MLLTGNCQLQWRQLSLATLRKPGYVIDSQRFHTSEFSDMVEELSHLVQLWRVASLSSFGYSSSTRIVAACSSVVDLLCTLYWLSLLWWDYSFVLAVLFRLNSAFRLLHDYDRCSMTFTKLFQERTECDNISTIISNIWLGTDWRMLMDRVLTVRSCEALLNVFILAVARIGCYGKLLSWHRIYRVSIAPSYRQVVSTAGVLQALRRRECNEPVDHSFAMNGVLRTLNGAVSTADYAKSKQQVYYELFRDLLSWRWMCLTLLLDAGSSDPQTSPSWVPQWDARDRTSWIPEKISYIGTSAEMLAQIRTQGLPVYHIDGSSLLIRGLCLGSVAYCVRLPEVYSDSTMEDCLHAILSWHWNMQFYGDCCRTADQSRMQSMIRILRFKISDIWLAFLARMLTDGRQTNYELGIQMVHPSNAATISKLVQQT